MGWSHASSVHSVADESWLRLTIRDREAELFGDEFRAFLAAPGSHSQVSSSFLGSASGAYKSAELYVFVPRLSGLREM